MAIRMVLFRKQQTTGILSEATYRFLLRSTEMVKGFIGNLPQETMTHKKALGCDIIKNYDLHANSAAEDSIYTTPTVCP